jgi:hypothetical protein
MPGCQPDKHGAINRLNDRLYVGGALANQMGNLVGGNPCLFGDWASQLIPNAICGAALVALSTSGLPYTTVFGVRHSDGNFYGLGSLFLGINDSVTQSFALETVYNETRAYYGPTPTLAEESDIINAAVPNALVAQLTPYNFFPSAKTIIANKWLSNGRPDLLQLAVSPGNNLVSGDVISFTFIGGYTGSPQTISTTVGSKDTVFAIITRLAAAFNANSTLRTAGMSAGTVPQSAAISATIPLSSGQFVSIANAPLPSAMTTTSSVVGSGTEITAVGSGANASIAVGGLNNGNGVAGVGGYYTGLAFQCNGLVGADCTDTGGFGEFAALSRKQSIDFYTSGNTPGNPSSRIFSSQISTITAGLSQDFRDGNRLDFEVGGTPQFSFQTTSGGIFVVAKGATFSAPGAGFGALQWVAGTTSGTCKLVALAGTSATPVTIVDNVGTGC